MPREIHVQDPEANYRLGRKQKIGLVISSVAIGGFTIVMAGLYPAAVELDKNIRQSAIERTIPESDYKALGRLRLAQYSKSIVDLRRDQPGYSTEFYDNDIRNLIQTIDNRCKVTGTYKADEYGPSSGTRWTTIKLVTQEDNCTDKLGLG